MKCRRCSLLPIIDYKNIGVCLTVPTRHHIEPIGILLDNNDINWQQDDDAIIFETDDFCWIIEELKKINFSYIELRDIRLLPFSTTEGLNFSSLKNHRNLSYWINLVNSRGFLDILADSRIKVMFQPILRVKDRSLYGYEGLSRGILANEEIMPPDEMFGIARDTDLMFYLDRLCRESVIAASAREHIDSKIFINFIPTSIYDPDKCLQSTDLALKQHGLNPEQIVFEVVETEYIEDFNHLNRILDYYRTRGYSTALDDMGSGYATQEALLGLNPDYLKVDMEIIQGIHLDDSKKRRLDGFLKLGSKHNIITLAEGVETQEEFDYVTAAGVDLVQGYLFGKPLEKLNIK